MCLILVSWHAHPDYPLVFAANRDEFYARESAPVHWWDTQPPVLAGRDLAPGAHGTWMGITADGRVAAVTNVREPGREVADPRSRGELVANYLLSQDDPATYLERVQAAGEQYNGFNLLVADHDELWWYSNRSGDPQVVKPGVHGVSNAALDTPWPKVVNGIAGFTSVLQTDHGDGPVDPYLGLLADDTPAPDAELPATGIPRELERAVSSLFIATPEYGTRASTVLRIRNDGSFDMTERVHSNTGEAVTRDFRQGY